MAKSWMSDRMKARRRQHPTVSGPRSRVFRDVTSKRHNLTSSSQIEIQRQLAHNRAMLYDERTDVLGLAAAKAFADRLWPEVQGRLDYLGIQAVDVSVSAEFTEAQSGATMLEAELLEVLGVEAENPQLPMPMLEAHAKMAIDYVVELVNTDQLPGADGPSFQDEIMREVRAAATKGKLLHDREMRAVRTLLGRSPLKQRVFAPSHVTAIAYVQADADDSMYQIRFTASPWNYTTKAVSGVDLDSLSTQDGRGWLRTEHPCTNVYTRVGQPGLKIDELVVDTINQIGTRLAQQHPRLYGAAAARRWYEGRQRARDISAGVCEPPKRLVAIAIPMSR